MNGSLTLLDDNLLYIAFSIIGISSKNEQEMKFRGRGEGHCPIRSFYLNVSKGAIDSGVDYNFDKSM